jgi:hypothetical protein
MKLLNKIYSMKDLERPFTIFYLASRRVAAFTQKINYLHIISAKKNDMLALKNIITDMGRIPLFSV